MLRTTRKKRLDDRPATASSPIPLAGRPGHRSIPGGVWPIARRRVQVKGRQGVSGLALGVLCLGLLCAPGAWAADFTYKAVAFLDTKAPGGGMQVNGDEPGGGKFGTIQGHTWTDVNDQGDVAFSVQVPDATGGMEQGVFVRMADGTYRAVARPGDTAPDGSHFARARRPNINNAGAVV